MRVIVFDLSSLYWSVAMARGLTDPEAPYEITIGRVVKLSSGFDSVAVACDGPGKSFRTAIDAAYKADRAERAPKLWAQLDAVRAELERRGFAVFVPPAYPDGLFPEGDDVIASIVRWYHGQGCRAEEGDLLRIVSGDSDLAALVDDAAGVELQRKADDGSWPTFTAKALTDGAWKERVPCAPKLLAEFKALAGDDSDGYKPFPGPEKGKPGIGEKGALFLLKTFGTAAAAAQAAQAEPLPEELKDPKLAGVVATLKRCGVEAAHKGLALATMRQDVELDFSKLLAPRPADEPASATPAQGDRDTKPDAGPPASAPRTVTRESAAREPGPSDFEASFPDERPEPPAPRPTPPRREAPPPVPVAELPSLADALAEMPPTLAAALVLAQGKVERVAKDSTNTYAKYKYASAEDMIDEARGALNAAGLALFSTWRFVPDLSLSRSRETDDGRTLTVGQIGRVVAQYTLVHMSGHVLRFETSLPVIPEKGRPEDKAELGALTANLGYTLRGLLLIPRGDDEGTGVDARDDRSYQPQQRGGGGYRSANNGGR